MEPREGQRTSLVSWSSQARMRSTYGHGIYIMLGDGENGHV